MSCGFLHFNPIAFACDWPANVINIRPECDKTFKHFGRRKQYGKKLMKSTTTTISSSTTTPTSTTITTRGRKKTDDEELKVI